MAGAVATDDSVASMARMGAEDRCESSDSLSEWRSCEQIENESPSTSPSFWDTDDEDDDPGPRPSGLFGRYTWRIENFSKEKKREMKSEPFEAGGYKWYILVYPQGCDVSNHLSLFLCVANHEKLLPGWSHFAQFTIAVGNLDPKKKKYSDTLHRFWKKEHDWGWKKFMELSKIQDGFLVDDVLEIIAQVQVIREKVDHPFRCLDRPYRRELLRVYMKNIEQIYRRFVEECRSKLSKLIEDKMRWSSFRAFWLAIDPSTRHHMSRERSDIILKIMVKHFFIEKEVTSTLVMDSLYTGLNALEHHSKGKKDRMKLMDLELEELSLPMVHVDMDMFVLSGDVIALLERAALEPLPCQPLSPKEDNCSQTRTKDGSSGEVNKVSIEDEERRLTELGQKILETFVLSHIFSGIEVAYQEAVALKRQEELIREEEEAGLLENEMKGKRGNTIEKEKRGKKKQAKQKKNNRKAKDKDREETNHSNSPERDQDETAVYDREDSMQEGKGARKVDSSEEGASDVSDNLDGSIEACQTDTGDNVSQPVNGMNDVIEMKNVQTGKMNPTVEIKSSSCSSEAVTMNSMHGIRNNMLDSRSQISPNREKTQRSRSISSMNAGQDAEDLPSCTSSGSDRNTSGCGPAPKLDQETVLLTSKDRLQKLGQRLHEKEIEGRKLVKAHLEMKAAAGSSSFSSSDKTPDVLKGPEQSSVTISNENINAPAPKSVPVATNHAVNGAVTPTSATTMSAESEPIIAPTISKVETVLCQEQVSSSTPQIDKAISITLRLAPVDKAATIPPSLPLIAPPKSPAPQVDKVVKAIPAPPKSPAPQVDKVAKAIPAPPKSPAPQVDKVAKAILAPSKLPVPQVKDAKAVPAPPKSPVPQVDKVAKAIPASPKLLAPQVEKVIKAAPAPPKLHSPQLDKVALGPLKPLLRQVPSASTPEAREDVPKKVVITSLPQTPTVTSRPSSVPLFQAPRSTLPPTSAVQVPPMLSRSMAVSGQLSNEPSPSIPSCVPQTYRNTIIGMGGLDSTLANLDQSTSLGKNIAVPQPLSAHASGTSAMMPPVGRNDQLPSKQGFMFGPGKPEALDNWHPWKVDSNNANKNMWMDGFPYQQMANGVARVHPWKENSYQQASRSGTEGHGRFARLQRRQIQGEIPANVVPRQLQVPVSEEFPHLDIINDLLEEEQSNGNMTECPLHEYSTFSTPISLRGSSAETEMTSVSSSGRFSLTDHYYDESGRGAYDRQNALHRLKEGQLPALDAYSDGRVDSISSKPWFYSYPISAVNLGVASNGFSQMGDYTSLASGRVNGEYLYRHANGQW